MQTFSPDETAFLEWGKDTGKHVSPISHVLKLITTCRDQWAWPDKDRGKWKVVDDNYQEFYNLWCGPGSSSKFLNEFP